MKRYLPLWSVVSLLALTLVSGIIHGALSDRWGPPHGLAEAAEKLKLFPEEFAGWKLTRTEMSDIAVNMLQCAGYVHGAFENQTTGSVVQIAVVLGPAQPITRHTPDVCYLAHNYSEEDRQQISIQNAEFEALVLRSGDDLSSDLKVYYAWHDGSRWSTLDESRWTIARHPYLYKIQLSTPIASDSTLDEENDPGREFLEDLLQVDASTVCRVPGAE